MNTFVYPCINRRQNRHSYLAVELVGGMLDATSTVTVEDRRNPAQVVSWDVTIIGVFNGKLLLRVTGTVPVVVTGSLPAPASSVLPMIGDLTITITNPPQLPVLVTVGYIDEDPPAPVGV